MKFHPSPEQQSERRRIIRQLFWCNVVFCVTNLTVAFTFGIIPCFFVGGACGGVVLLLWDDVWA